MNIMLLVHLDFSDNRGIIRDLLPMDEITLYVKRHNLWVIEAYSDHSVTSFDSVDAREICHWFSSLYPEKQESLMFKDDDILLIGGYRSLCYKHVYDALSTVNQVTINPDWVVSDPRYINSDLFPFWEYPANACSNI